MVWCAYELADGRRGGGERGDGVGEDAGEHRREASVVGEGQPREHPVQGVQPLRARLLRGGRSGRGRRRRLLRHFPALVGVGVAASPAFPSSGARR